MKKIAERNPRGGGECQTDKRLPGKFRDFHQRKAIGMKNFRPESCSAVQPPGSTGRLAKADAEAETAPYLIAVEELFAAEETAADRAVDRAAPLATRMRPRTLDEFAGQHHILAPGKLL